jgi:hypothetical protein
MELSSATAIEVPTSEKLPVLFIHYFVMGIPRRIDFDLSVFLNSLFYWIKI